MTAHQAMDRVRRELLEDSNSPYLSSTMRWAKCEAAEAVDGYLRAPFPMVQPRFTPRPPPERWTQRLLHILMPGWRS